MNNTNETLKLGGSIATAGVSMMGCGCALMLMPILAFIIFLIIAIATGG